MTNKRRPNGSGPFRVSEAASLGLHALAVIAAAPEPATRARAIAARLRASAAHLAKVMVALERAGLVAGTRGPAGGYRLNRPARSISLREIYEAVEGPMQARACLFGAPVCKSGRCALSSYFGRLNRDVIRTLERTRLTDLVGEFGGKGGVISIGVSVRPCPSVLVWRDASRKPARFSRSQNIKARRPPRIDVGSCNHKGVDE
jgi:Rrf2 family protein